jgi:predicted HicB family RNase H-like nuclease
MYEMSDWGRPVASPEWGGRERLTTQLPHSLVRVLRSRARAQGVSLNVLVDRLLHEALSMTPVDSQQTGMVVGID